MTAPGRPPPGPRRADHHADVVVVGAGVFGAAIAVALARQGRSVFLLERSLKEPNRIIGELMQPGGVRALEKLGLRHCLDNIDAVPVEGCHIIFNDRSATLRYPRDDSRATSRQIQTGRTGLSFHHGRFVRQLRSCAAREANITVVETEVDGLVKTEGSGQVLGVKSVTAGERDYFFAPLTIVADGHKSRFRGEISSQKPVAKSKFWALDLLHDVPLPAAHFGHILFGPFSPVLLYQVGTRETRALVNVPNGLGATRSANGGIAHYMRHHVLPRLPLAIQPAFAQNLDRGGLRCMSNSSLPAAANRTPGPIVAGDALNMRHPLTGGGMAVALNDVVLLAGLLSQANDPDLNDARRVLRQAKTFHWRRKRHSFVINVLAQALYLLFAAEDFYLETLRRGCFEYFTMGGACVDGPTGLLGGIYQAPLMLVYHFFAIALFSMWILLTSQPLWRLPLTLMECEVVLQKACWVLFPNMAAELM